MFKFTSSYLGACAEAFVAADYPEWVTIGLGHKATTAVATGWGEADLDYAHTFARKDLKELRKWLKKIEKQLA